MSSIIQLLLHRRGGETKQGSLACELGEVSEHLVKLRELTSKLKGVPAAQIVGGTIGPSSYTMQTERGDKKEIEIFPLYFDGILRIERALVPKGHRLKTHYHEGEVQHISVVRGSATIKMCPPGMKPKIYEIKQGRSAYIPSLTPHNFQAIEDCYIVNVFMPCPQEEKLLRSVPMVKETSFDDEDQ